MSKKLKELQERELQTKQMEEHQKQEYKRKIKELQKKVREEELNMLMRMQERLQNETAERQNEIANEIDQFMKTQKENYEKQLKAFSKGGGAGGGNTSMTPPTTSTSTSTGSTSSANLLSTDFSSLATISKPSASQLKLQAIFQVKTFDDISFKPIGIDVWKCGGFLHCYFIIERGILKVPTRKNANTITFKNNPEEYLKMNPKVPPPPGYIPPPPPVTASTPIVNTGGVFKMNITRKETSSLDKFEKASSGSGGSSGVIDLKDILAQKSKLKAATPNTATTNKSEPSTPIGMSNTLFTSLQMRRKQMAADSDDDDDTDEHNSTTLKHDTKQTNPMMAMLLSRIERLKREQKEILDEEAWEEEFGTSASKNKFQGGGAESSDTSTSEDSDW
ncbi:hypothetical protein C9374_007727 [Naegleria lovaniensis]|uniref:Uncharacterized protein n=1 Tax=Naegleria lovaniensis TaxID=51637 RepID=A0AA88GGP4_NAELO|nr:uncharacterized protein C9374_007727 [Naegleria lovaniensis]KAG2379089.1 hypothetical protein C9374_007727 [Naegleria lovaniensis]